MSGLFDISYFDCQSFNELLKEVNPLENIEDVLMNCHTHTPHTHLKGGK